MLRHRSNILHTPGSICVAELIKKGDAKLSKKVSNFEEGSILECFESSFLAFLLCERGCLRYGIIIKLYYLTFACNDGLR